MFGMRLLEFIVSLTILIVIIFIFINIAKKKKAIPQETKKSAALIPCPACGRMISNQAISCPSCGHLLNPQSITSKTEKSRSIAILLALLLGGFGIHKFYVDKPGVGLVYLLFCWTFIPVFFGFFEGIQYLLMTNETFQTKYQQKKL